jgi:hypothetical protein
MDRLFAVPNLDDLSADDAEYRRAAGVLDALASYCRLKAMAVQSRRIGNLTVARGCDARLEEMYNRLPGWARW